MRFFTRSARPVRKNHTVTPSTNLSGGTVPNHAWHLTGRSSSGTGSFSNRRTSRPPRSMCDWPPSGSLRGKRDRAILALLIGCGLRRADLVGLRTEDFQIREERCVIADLVGKGKHIRTVPVPLWAKRPSMSGSRRRASTAGRSFVE
jgi:Phage integrase family